MNTRLALLGPKEGTGAWWWARPKEGTGAWWWVGPLRTVLLLASVATTVALLYFFPWATIAGLAVCGTGLFWAACHSVTKGE